jgi:hypothetical protein
MFNQNSLVDEKWLLAIIALGTLVIYLITPTPNVLYREENRNNDIIDFGQNTECYGVTTTEIDCPADEVADTNQSASDMPHNLNMHIEDK